MPKFLENLQEAERLIHALDHIAYVSFPLIKDKKLLLKILLETKIAITNCVNSILQYEYLQKKIILDKNPKVNFDIFKEKCSKKYNINQKEIEQISKLFDIVEKHRQSPFEFTRNEKVIILSENLKTETITLEKTREFLELGKTILKKTKQGILKYQDTPS